MAKNPRLAAAETEIRQLRASLSDMESRFAEAEEARITLVYRCETLRAQVATLRGWRDRAFQAEARTRVKED